MGRRISKKVYTGTSGTGWTLSTHQKFVYDGFKQIAEFDSSDNLQKTYTWQPVGLDVPLWVNDSSNYYYYIVDGNKNVREMVDTSGNLVASYDYNPFGKITSSGTYASTNKFRFSSEYHDDETELVYYNYRYYDPELGRWINRDPIGEKDGYNLYCFIENKSINTFDYLGMISVNKALVKEWKEYNKNNNPKVGFRHFIHKSLEFKFENWVKWDAKEGKAWLSEIPKCPSRIKFVDLKKTKPCDCSAKYKGRNWRGIKKRIKSIIPKPYGKCVGLVI